MNFVRNLLLNKAWSMKRRKMLRTTTMFISVLAIALIAIGTYFIVYRNISTYDSQLQMVQKDLLINFQSKVDEALKAGTDEISVWVLEDSVVQFASEEKHDYYNALRIVNKHKNRMNVQYDLDCIYGIFRPEQDVFITNVGIMHSDTMTRQYNFVSDAESVISKLPEKTYVNNFYIANELSSTDNRLNLIVKRNPANHAGVTVYGIVSLNLQQIARQISQQENVSFFCFVDDECIFSSSTKNIQGMRTLQESSDLIHNLTFVIGTEKRSNIVLWLIYGSLLLLLVVGGLYGSFSLARFLHRPIENILKQVSTEDEIDVYDEEAYISKRFVEIRQVNQKLEAQVSAQEQYLKQNFVRDLLYGIVSDEALASKGADYGVQNFSGDVVLALLEANNEVQGPMYLNQITALLTAKLENSIVTFLTSGQVAVIARSISEDEFKTAIAQSILQIEEWYGVSYTGAISAGKLTSPRELSRLFNDAMRYLQSGNFSHDKLIITKEDLFEREGYTYYYPLEFEKNIISYITNNDFDKALQIVRMILDKNLVEMQLSKAAQTELKFALVGTIKRLLQTFKKTEAELFGEGSILYLELSACKTSEEISEKFYEIFSAIRCFAEEAFDTSNYTLIDQIEAYIQENYYREEMSLFFLAEQFNLTSGYISRIFKKYRDVNFKDYLSACRIQKATEILEMTPDIRVADLAQQVGYDNVQRFVRNFKKLKNVSPGEYKKQK